MVFTSSCKKEKDEEMVVESISVLENTVATFLVGDPLGNDIVLYSVSDDKNVHEVTVQTNIGDFYTHECISNYGTINEKYDYAVTKTNGNVDKYYTYLIERKSGTAYKISDGYLVDFADNFAPIVEWDNNGNIYFYVLAEDFEFYKLNTNALPHIDKKTISKPDERIANFTVDRDGNLLYSSIIDNDNRFIRLVSADGDETEIAAGDFPYASMWLGLDGEICVEHDGAFHKVDVENKKLVEWTDNSTMRECFYEYLLKIEDKDKMIFVGDCDTYAEVYPEVRQSLSYEGGFGIASHTGASASSDFVYMTGFDESGIYHIVKIDPNNNSYSKIRPEKLELHRVVSVDNDNVIVSGYDFNNNQYFIGHADFSANELKVLQRFDERVTLTFHKK